MAESFSNIITSCLNRQLNYKFHFSFCIIFLDGFKVLRRFASIKALESLRLPHDLAELGKIFLVVNFHYNLSNCKLRGEYAISASAGFPSSK